MLPHIVRGRASAANLRYPCGAPVRLALHDPPGETACLGLQSRKGQHTVIRSRVSMAAAPRSSGRGTQSGARPRACARTRCGDLYILAKAALQAAVLSRGALIE